MVLDLGCVPTNLSLTSWRPRGCILDLSFSPPISVSLGPFGPPAVLADPVVTDCCCDGWPRSTKGRGPSLPLCTSVVLCVDLLLQATPAFYSVSILIFWTSLA